MATRFNKIGLSGRLGEKSDTGLILNRGDYTFKIVSFVPKIVASTAAQDTGISINPGAKFNSFVRILTAESTGTTKTIDVGLVGGSSTALIDGANVAGVGVVAQNNAAPVGQTRNVSYSLGSANFAELDCEVVILFVEENT